MIPYYERDGITIYHADNRHVLCDLPSQSVDCVVSDPPYPEIDRSYGRMTVDDWWFMMVDTALETKRILKPTGSAVFILQPNSERVGKMRTWLWEFVVWAGKHWNIIQDVYWWNTTALPTVFAHRDYGLTKPSVKLCLWLGDPECYRNQDAVLCQISGWTLRGSRRNDEALEYHNGTKGTRGARMVQTPLSRGGAVPFNLLAFPNNDPAHDGASQSGHDASTPFDLCDWWVRYLCHPGGTVADWFMGTGTTLLAGYRRGCKTIGIEREQRWCDAAIERLAQGVMQFEVGR